MLWVLILFLFSFLPFVLIYTQSYIYTRLFETSNQKGTKTYRRFPLSGLKDQEAFEKLSPFVYKMVSLLVARAHLRFFSYEPKASVPELASLGSSDEHFYPHSGGGKYRIPFVDLSNSSHLI